MQPGRRRLLGLSKAAPGSDDRPPAVAPGGGMFTARIGRSCLAARRIECRVCREHCATGAVRLQFAPGQVARPHVDVAACTGCGACLHACPADAIKLEPVAMEQCA